MPPGLLELLRAVDRHFDRVLAAREHPAPPPADEAPEEEGSAE